MDELLCMKAHCLELGNDALFYLGITRFFNFFSLHMRHGLFLYSYVAYDCPIGGIQGKKEKKKEKKKKSKTLLHRAQHARRHLSAL